MTPSTLARLAAVLGALAASPLARAADPAPMASPGHAHAPAMEGHGAMSGHGGMATMQPTGPIGDMMPMAGQFHVALMGMAMSMGDTLDGDSRLSAAQILARPNPFFGQPMQPPNLRVVPTEMSMQMLRLQLAYGVTPWLGLTASVNRQSRSMTMAVFNPPGTALVGTVEGTSQGIGDAEIGAKLRLLETGPWHAHLTLGLSLPTGSIEETGVMLTPLGGTMVMRRPYGMQLGSGTPDLKPAAVIAWREGLWAAGLRASGTLRLGRNSETYSLGDEAGLELWGSRGLGMGLRVHGRLGAHWSDDIDGQDALIRGAMQGTDPDNYGGFRAEAGLGLTWMAMGGPLDGLGLVVEGRLPLYQNLNGPQMSQDWGVMAGVMVRF